MLISQCCFRLGFSYELGVLKRNLWNEQTIVVALLGSILLLKDPFC